MTFFISVVIATHDRCKILQKTLKRLIEQNYPKNKYEILVASDAIDGTNEMVESLAKKARCKLRLINSISRWPDVKRNLGIKNAKGQIIALTDDDVLTDKNWLKEIDKLFSKDKKLLGVEGKTIAEKNRGIFYHATENLKGGKYPACNMAFRRSALVKVKGFDENYNFFREDTDIAFKVISIGKMIFAENAKVFHPARKFPPWSILRELKMAKGDVRLFKKFPELYRQTYGFLCKGGIKLGILSWLWLIVLIWFLIEGNYLEIIGLLIALILFKYFLYLKNKKFSILEGIEFIVITGIRDLLYPFYLVYYYLTVNPKVWK